MKVIIAGSRGIVLAPIKMEEIILASKFKVAEVVSGTCYGVDKSGEDWAKWSLIPIRKFPADWERYGKSAGYKRNEQMARYADALIAIWDGNSKGTEHMISIANKYQLKIYIRKFT